MQYQVPQFIEVEDKIVGPFSFRQAIYIGVSLSISAALYFTIQTWLWAILSVFIVGGGFGMALVKVNGQPLSKLVRYMFEFYWKPQSYLWQPEVPNLPKNEDTIRQVVGPEMYLEKILSGFALKNAWQYVQTGNQNPQAAEKVPAKPVRERYQIFHRLTGDRMAAKRVDYR